VPAECSVASLSRTDTSTEPFGSSFFIMCTTLAEALVVS